MDQLLAQIDIPAFIDVEEPRFAARRRLPRSEAKLGSEIAMSERLGVDYDFSDAPSCKIHGFRSERSGVSWGTGELEGTMQNLLAELIATTHTYTR